MRSLKLDPDLEQLLENDVNDLARYNILQYLHDHPDAEGDVDYFVDELGLRSQERTADALEALVHCSLLTKTPPLEHSRSRYRLSSDPTSRALVDRLCALRSTSCFGEIVERLAARSLSRVRRAQALARAGRGNGNRHG